MTDVHHHVDLAGLDDLVDISEQLRLTAKLLQIDCPIANNTHVMMRKSNAAGQTFTYWWSRGSGENGFRQLVEQLVIDCELWKKHSDGSYTRA